MRKTSPRRLAALALLAVGAGQLLATPAQARLWLDNGVSMNGLRINGANLNGANLNGTAEQGLETRRSDATPPSVDVGRLRLRAVRPDGDR